MNNSPDGFHFRACRSCQSVGFAHGWMATADRLTELQINFLALFEPASEECGLCGIHIKTDTSRGKWFRILSDSEMELEPENFKA